MEFTRKLISIVDDDQSVCESLPGLPEARIRRNSAHIGVGALCAMTTRMLGIVLVVASTVIAICRVAGDRDSAGGRSPGARFPLGCAREAKRSPAAPAPTMLTTLVPHVDTPSGSGQSIEELMGYPKPGAGLIDASIVFSSEGSLAHYVPTVHDQPPDRASVPSGLP